MIKFKFTNSHMAQPSVPSQLRFLDEFYRRFRRGRRAQFTVAHSTATSTHLFPSEDGGSGVSHLTKSCCVASGSFCASHLGRRLQQMARRGEKKLIQDSAQRGCNVTCHNSRQACWQPELRHFYGTGQVECVTAILAGWQRGPVKQVRKIKLPAQLNASKTMKMQPFQVVFYPCLSTSFK